MGKPILYAGNETDFNHLGLGVLHNTTSALVTEERNGSFVLDLVYQFTEGDLVAKEIKVGNIIKADAGHKLKNQRFRIKRITRAMNNQLKVYAEHISYLSYDLQLKNGSSVTGTADIAIKAWKTAIMGTVNPFTVSSDITTSTSTIWSLDVQENARLALGGSRGSLLDIWGGEFIFDNYDIKLLAQRGKVADTLIAYGRNLSEYEDETDITDVFTSIRPYVKYTDDKTKQTKYIYSNPEIIDHKNAPNFPNQKTFVYDMSSEFDMSSGKPLPTPASIATAATAYMNANDFGVPKTSMKLSFVDLSKTLDYTQYKALEEVNLCDMIPIRYEQYGVTGNAKVTKVIWNVLADAYDSLELGQPARSLAQRFSQLQKDANAASSTAQYAMGIALTAGDQQVFYGDTQPPASTVGLTDGAIWYKQHGTNGVEMYTWDATTQTWVYVIGENDTDLLEQKINGEIAKRDVQIGSVKTVADNALQQTQNLANQVALIDASARNLLSGSSFQAVTSTGAWEYPVTIPIKAGEDYSFGGLMIPDKLTNMKIEVLPATGSTGTGFTLTTATPLPSGVSTRVGVSGKSTTAIPKAILRFTPSDLTTKTAHSESMFTESTIPQDWQPAPEDVQKGIYGLQQDLTKAEQDIADAKTALDNLSVGARNYLRNSRSPQLTKYSNATLTKTEDVAVAEWNTDQAVTYTITSGTTDIFATLTNAGSPKIPYQDNEKRYTPMVPYVNSIYVKNRGTHSFVITNNYNDTVVVAPNEVKRVVLKAKNLSSTNRSLQFVFQKIASDATRLDYVFDVWHAKIEQGTAVTDWSPSPLDAEVDIQVTQDSIATKVSQTDFDTLKGTVNGYSTQFTQMADSIKLKADQSSVNTLDSRVTKNESDIDLNADAIKLKVNQTDYDALAKTVGQHSTTIAQTSSQISLMATKTELAGKASQTDFAALQVTVGGISTKIQQQDQKFSTLSQTVDGFTTKVVAVSSLLVDPTMQDATIIPILGLTTGMTRTHEASGWRFVSTNAAPQRFYWSNTSPSTGKGLYEGAKMNQTYSVKVVMQVPTTSVNKSFVLQVGDARQSIVPKDTYLREYEYVLHSDANGVVSLWMPTSGGECLVTEITIREHNTNITTVKFSQVEQDVNGLKVSVADKVSAAQLKVESDRITTVVSQVNQTDVFARAASGKLLSEDPMFQKGTSGFALYDQQGGQITMSRDTIAGGSQPTGVNSRMKFVSTGQYMSGSRQTLGGWSQVTNARLNAEFLVRFTALLPVGYVFQNGSNSIGTGGTRTWLTDNKGTGNWEEYAYLVKCGTGGTFSSFGFNYVQGSPIPTTAAPMTWYVAKYETIDISSNISSQFTQLSDQINLRVSKNDVVNQINVSTEGIKIDGTKVHITGSTLIDNAVIKSAMIDTLSTSKLTAGTISTAVMNLIKLNANQIIAGTIDAARLAAKSITADKLAADAIQVGFNAIGNTIQIDSNSLDIRSGTKLIMSLTGTGNHFYDNVNSKPLGVIGYQFKTGSTTIRGLGINLENDADFIAFGHKPLATSTTYDPMMMIDATGQMNSGGFKGVQIDAQTRFNGGIKPEGTSTTIGYIGSNTVSGVTGAFTTFKPTGGKAGFGFNANTAYVFSDGDAFSVTDLIRLLRVLNGLGAVQIPTTINTSGNVTKWKNVTF